MSERFVLRIGSTVSKCSMLVGVAMLRAARISWCGNFTVAVEELVDNERVVRYVYDDGACTYTCPDWSPY